jgi:hypothetical protein
MRVTTKKLNSKNNTIALTESFPVRGCHKEMTGTRKNFRQAQKKSLLMRACDTVSIGNGDVEEK